MAIFYLVRHGSNDVLGKALAARLPNIHLNAQGRAEAERIARVLNRKQIDRIFSSPLERAQETAAPLATSLGLTVEISDAIHEIAFGDWSGKLMTELESSDQWKAFNSYRSGTRIPNGETMLEAQSRVVAFLLKLFTEQPNGTFALFSHGDPIKSAIAYFLGVPLDVFTRIEIGTGSFSMLRLEAWGPQILAVNVCPE
jgi:broad specificity phosphatase PhoE